MNTITPQSGPSGTKITIAGSEFGSLQEQSLLIFKRGDDKILRVRL
ncbi:IPT/TIG domain-containing protein [Atribacter laminatus]